LTKVINEFCNFYYLFYLALGEEYKTLSLVIQENYNNLPAKGTKKKKLHHKIGWQKKKKVSDNWVIKNPNQNYWVPDNFRFGYGSPMITQLTLVHGHPTLDACLHTELLLFI